MVDGEGTRRGFWSAAAVVAGLGLGFVVAGLATEVYEEFAAQARYEDGEFAGFDEGPLAGQHGFLGAATTFVATLGLLWAAYRRRGARGGLLLTALAVSTPAWYAFYQVDHREALVGVGLALGVAWTALAWTTTRSGHAALAGGMALAAAIPVWNMWSFSRLPFHAPFPTPQLTVVAALGAASLAALLVVLARVPEERLPRAGGLGALATGLATALVSLLPVFDRFAYDEPWVFSLGLAVLAGCAAVAWSLSRPQTEPPVA